MPTVHATPIQRVSVRRIGVMAANRLAVCQMAMVITIATIVGALFAIAVST